MATSRRAFLTAIAAGAIWASPRRAWAGSPAAARAFITELGNDAVRTLQADAPSSQKSDQLKELFRRAFDFPAIGRFVLGRYWNNASQQQQAEFLEVFTDFVTTSYARRLADETVSGFSITGLRDLGDGDYLVQTAIMRPNGPQLNYEWRVRSQPSGMRIVDVIVEGVSLLVTQRSDFTSVVQREGMDGLIRSLRRKVSA